MINLRNLTKKQIKQISIGTGIGVAALMGIGILIYNISNKTFGEWVTTPRMPVRKYIDIARPSRGSGSIIEGGRASKFGYSRRLDVSDLIVY